MGIPNHTNVFNGDLKDIPPSVRKISGRCPTTGDRVLAVEQKQFSMTKGKVVWWRCPSCDGWHAVVLEDKN